MKTPNLDDPFPRPMPGTTGDRLWDVVGSGRGSALGDGPVAEHHRVSQTFTQDVLRRIRQEPHRSGLLLWWESVSSSVVTLVSVPAARVSLGVCAAVIMLICLLGSPWQPRQPAGQRTVAQGETLQGAQEDGLDEVAGNVVALAESPNSKVLGRLDELLAMEDSSLWLGDSASNF
jgi:hypothetical protein